MSRKINILELRVVRGSGGGPEKTIFLSAEKIDKDNFSTIVAYIGQKGDRSFGVTKRAKGKDVQYVELWENGRFDWQIIRQLLRIIKEYSIDIVHGHDYKSDVYGWVLRLFTPVKLISTAHGWIGNDLKERFYNSIDRKILCRYDKVIAVNKPIAEALKNSGVNPKIIEIIHNAIEAEDYSRDKIGDNVRNELNISAEDPVIGFVGRISAEKDLPTLFTAIKQSLTDFPDLKVLIVGDGPLLCEMRENCRQTGIEKHVIFLGQRQDTKRIYAAMDIFTLVSKTEGIPNVVLEAMAMNVPVISTNVGGIGEIITHNLDGILIQRGDTSSLSHYIKELLTNDNYRNSITNAGRKRVLEYFDFSVRLKKFEDIYKKLILEK